MREEKCLKSGVSSPSNQIFIPQDPNVLIWNSGDVYAPLPFKEQGKVSRCTFGRHYYMMLTNNLWRGVCFILFCLLKVPCLFGLWISCLAAYSTLAPTLVHVYMPSSPSDLLRHVWPLPPNSSWSPSCSSMVCVCGCFVKLLGLCNMMQPTKIDPSEELISLWSTRPFSQLKPLFDL